MKPQEKLSQYRADVAQDNGEIQSRSQDLLNPDSKKNREEWNAAQVAAHERLFPFSDNLTTLMFNVASDLSEAQRERLTSSLSPQGVDVTAYTFESATAVFVELFCTPKSSKENPSLRVNKHSGSTSRAFIVEDLIGDEFGQRATDEETGEQGYVDDEESCFWTWDNKKYAWQSRPFWNRKLKKKKGKGKNKGGLPGTRRALLGEEQAHESEMRTEEDGVWWYKENEERKASAFQKLMKSEFRTSPFRNGSSSEIYQHKGKGKDSKRKGKRDAYPRQDFQLLKIPFKRDLVLFGNKAVATPNVLTILKRVRGTIQDIQLGWRQVPLILFHHPTHVVLDLGFTRSIGSRMAIRRFQKKSVVYMGLRLKIYPCNKSFELANTETETCREICNIHFPTKPPCSTRVVVLETSDVPILLSLSKMQNLGVTFELDPKGAKITCPAFGLHSSPAEYSRMVYIMLDLMSLAYQPKSRERSARPPKHATFALSQKKSAYPAHSQELDDDEDDKPLVRPDGTIVSEEDEGDKLLVQPTSVLNRESSAKRGVPLPVRSRKGPPVWQDPSETLEQDVSGTSREPSGDISSLGELSSKLSTGCRTCAT